MSDQEMTVREFNTQLDHLEEQKRAGQERVDGRYDQQLAKILIKSGWTQEKIATHLTKKWGKPVSQTMVSFHLRFGRFMSFFITECNKDSFLLPPNLTEGAFRKLWEATEPSGEFRGHKASTRAAESDEQRRFAEVIEELKGIGLRRPGKCIKHSIVKCIGTNASSRAYSVEEIRDKITVDFKSAVSLEDVTHCLIRWNASNKFPYQLDTRISDGKAQYRLIKVRGVIPSRKQMRELKPQLDTLFVELDQELRKERVELSLTHLRTLADRLKKVWSSVSTHQVAVKSEVASSVGPSS